jgi:predicted CXXCH cytochrome family protein
MAHKDVPRTLIEEIAGMKPLSPGRRTKIGLAFLLAFGACLALGAAYGTASSAAAAPAAQATATPNPSGPATYVGPVVCESCHSDVHESWSSSRHSQAFSSPVFQEDWTKDGSKNSCLECHTTGYEPVSGRYAFEGVTCESCHGPFQQGHPEQPMPVTPDATLCATCHKTTTNEWRASKHGMINLACEACHDPHAQKPMFDNVTALCTNCHKDPGQSFTHGTHANSGLQCSNCHMYTSPATTHPIQGLTPTGHTFSVGSEACIGCHQDTVHSRATILELSGQASAVDEPSLEQLQQQVQVQQAEIADLQATNSARLYTGLIQGGIVGLVMGGVVAWIVSRRLKIVDLDDEG